MLFLQFQLMVFWDYHIFDNFFQRVQRKSLVLYLSLFFLILGAIIIAKFTQKSLPYFSSIGVRASSILLISSLALCYSILSRSVYPGGLVTLDSIFNLAISQCS